MNLLRPLKRSFYQVCMSAARNRVFGNGGLVDREAHADGDEVICKGRPVNRKARVARDRSSII